MRSIQRIGWALVLMTGALMGQQNIDYSSAKSVIPWPVLPYFPGVCRPGAMMAYSILPFGSNNYQCANDGKTWNAMSGTGGASVWGGITGNLGDQTDLTTAFSLKADATALTSGLATKGGLTSSNAWSTTNTFSGFVDIATGALRPPTVAFASLPSAASASGRLFAISDTTNTSTCTVGSLFCLSNGTSYIGINAATGGAAAWGSITGTLSSQSDLNTALTGKAGLGIANTFTNTNTFSGFTDLLSGTFRPPAVAFGSLPSASATSGRLFAITSSSASSPCSGASVLCLSNGTQYIDIGSSAGPSAGVSSMTGAGIACDGTSGTGNCVWTPPSSVMTQGSDNAPTGRWDARNASATFPHKTTAGAAPSAACTSGQTLYRNDINPGKLYICPADAAGVSTSNWVEIPQGSVSSGTQRQTYMAHITAASGPQATPTGSHQSIVFTVNGPVSVGIVDYGVTGNALVSTRVTGSTMTFKNPCVTLFGLQPVDAGATLDLLKDTAGNNTYTTTGVSIPIPAGQGASNTRSEICVTASTTGNVGDYFLWRLTNSSASASIFVAAAYIETERP